MVCIWRYSSTPWMPAFRPMPLRLMPARLLTLVTPWEFMKPVHKNALKHRHYTAKAIASRREVAAPIGAMQALADCH